MWRVMETPLNCAEEQQPPPASWSTVTPQESTPDRNDKGNAVGFVLVHAGAGYHSESKAKEYKHVCKRACQRAVDRLKAGALAVDAVTAALVELEDSPFTNAGMGSNLNLSGEIECDASIMDGKSLRYGAVGAVSGINNPVLVANRLLSEAQKGKLSAGRIPPCFLVGRGAHDWAVNHGIPPCPSEKMATKFSLSAYKRNKHKMELAEKVDTGFNHHSKKRRQASETAAHHGCGCWAENTSTLNPYSTAVSTSGCGEHLIRTMLARECSSAMQCEDAHQALLEAMQNKFISSPFLASEDCVLGGVIVLRCCRCSDAQPSPDIQAILVEFLWSHTTESMCVGYMSAQDGKAKTHISRLPPGAVAGQSLAIEGGVCRLVNTPTTVD
ncbi:threonine aspartase 1 isoform X3 [Oncorhynchus nerka]|uniref:threonine aspartase 1 isoform X3 n=1 Tax=Oncorhynchus nerka TaxID=8023 RepID=UPI0031B8A978